ncbi:TPA: DUF350 domain-containing protein [Candidatus Micrarchaeota archaeon]|nr:DUF350 domain-containing protein [Candidatus Micrarchaeota archaeon]HIH30095.1 DUF350 domain-containing protein [Candidatus Micrarchaeota archaeon]
MGIENILLGLGIAIIQLIVGLALAMGSVYLGLKMFDRLTEGTNEMAELKKGNVAIAILLGAIILSIANIMEGGVSGLTGVFNSGLSYLETVAALFIGLVNLAIGVVFSIFSIYIAVNMLDKITVGIDEFKELRKGNVAVAIMMAAVLIAVSFVIRGAVAGISNAVSPQSVAAAIGWA